MKALRLLVTAAGLLVVWQIVVWATQAPFFILPAPHQVALAWITRAGVILPHAAVTMAEILLGLFLGCFVGALSALAIEFFRPARRWLMPVLVISQAIPVFAIAPLLTLWFGYGMPSKVAMATLIIYFPVTASFLDGLRRTDPAWIDTARTMIHGRRARRAILLHIRLPAALPALASGLRVAAAVAPIGAVVGEWVGSSAGLGFLMLHANARMQVDLMFAALLTLAVIALVLYFALDWALRRAIPWAPESLAGTD
jgi:putative hydroxymethylpyrimidine transport system permease protein